MLRALSFCVSSCKEQPLYVTLQGKCQEKRGLLQVEGLGRAGVALMIVLRRRHRPLLAWIRIRFSSVLCPVVGEVL